MQVKEYVDVQEGLVPLSYAKIHMRWMGPAPLMAREVKGVTHLTGRGQWNE